MKGAREHGASLGRAEWLAAALVALLLAAWPLRAGLLDGDRVLFAVDTATVQEPWSSALREAGTDGPALPRQPGLADQGVFFYPVYRFVVESWLDGEPPLWNPWIYAGVPCAGNPQAGVFDPQVALLALFEALGGRALFDRGLGLLAWLRLAAAGLGAFALARRLGLGRAGAALAALTFGGSGFLVLWVNASPGHVGPFLPWLLFALEGTRGPRPGRAATVATLLLAAAILGGHPETAFFVGAAGGLWALALLRADRAAGTRALLALLCGAGIGALGLVPFIEYLGDSGALLARRLRDESATVDLVALGVLLLGWGIVLHGRRAAPPGERAPAASFRNVALALALLGVTAVLTTRGLGRVAALALLPDLFGAPGGGGYLGPGHYLEVASGWVPWPVLPLAFASLVGAPTHRLARRPLIAGLGVLSFLLVLGVPGLADLARSVPLVGLGVTARLAVVSALLLGLLAGEALERAPRPARLAGAVLAIGWGALALAHAEPVALPAELTRADAADQVTGFLERPPERIEEGTLSLSGWLLADVPAHVVRLRLEGLDAGGGVRAGVVHAVPAELAREPWPELPPALRAQIPEGARLFRVRRLDLRQLPEGSWRCAVEFVDEAGTVVGERTAGVFRLVRPPRSPIWTWTFAALVLLGLVALPRGRTSAWLLCGLAGVHVLLFAEGKNPAVPRAECFPSTRTEEVLGRVLGERRYFAAPGILPANTGVLARLRDLDGYDALDAASFDLYRSYALRPGTHPLLGWNAYGADLEAPAFRLLGVGALLTPAPLEAPGWELVAGPRNAPERAEVYVSRALDPHPRVFCVARRVPRETVLADPRSFDPLETVFLDDDVSWTADRPFARASAEIVSARSGLVSIRASLDGDGLLVFTDQYFTGWEVEVDGEPGTILRADAIFRGVPLAAGDHRIVFHYNPRSLWIGAWIAAAALVAALALAWR